MREIKFRAWGKHDNKMHFEVGVSQAGSPVYDGANWVGGNLMQYTGLKDKNGREIYEGDLFECHYKQDGCKEQLMEVVYSEHATAFKLKRRGICQQPAVVQNVYNHAGWNGEIIGNIYENPDLLSN